MQKKCACIWFFMCVDLHDHGQSLLQRDLCSVPQRQWAVQMDLDQEQVDDAHLPV